MKEDENGFAEPIRRPTFVGIGELIWDLLPDGRRLGGAPSNFAYHSGLLGNRAVVASRVGDDEPGREAIRELAGAGVGVDDVQVDAEHPTGTVGVEVDGRGEAHFKVNPGSAWDNLEMSERWAKLAAEAQVVCFGTLGQRDARARATILSFLKLTRPEALRLFDVNLRHSFFTAEMLTRSLELATVVKFNSHELTVAAEMLGLDGSGEDALCRRLIERCGLELVAVTRGAGGSALFSEGRTVEHQGYSVPVVDTIGCGDAFAAALAHCVYRGMSLEAASEAANRMGSWVATQSGATPRATPRTVEVILRG